MSNYLFLATFSNPFQYAILKSILEREGIRFFFQNETVIGLLPFYSLTSGGIHLKVHPEDFENAKLLFEEFKYNSHLKIT
ncbi:DUF2007 domain-containing protein [Mesonia sp.]|uniref:DUF2007 domain-containing protein n=1 Tax=Mesonia sp. TaxID=1960830 RepID=UPI00176AEC78|nr:DUF2007 domain-containing protein [Mesonia sp.]HIB37289.1 DUF2007 domain-containing protein [Mesonia sp.]HIO27536.1 DUF2007 domain-containing protein [Flavobacteriaceae bacterium]